MTTRQRRGFLYIAMSLAAFLAAGSTTLIPLAATYNLNYALRGAPEEG